MEFDIISTEKLAAQIGVKPQSIRARICRYNDYFGVTPLKLLNGRLRFPPDAASRLIRRSNDEPQAKA